MEDTRLHAHTAVVAAHLAAKQQQQHQVQAQAHHQATAAAFARSNSFLWRQQAAVANNANVAQVQNGYSNFMPSIMAMQSNMANITLVVTSKLAPNQKNKASDSSLAVRTTVPRMNVAGGIYTVAQWTRKCVEDNLEFIVKIARRDDPKENLVMLAYGDGCQTLVFFDDSMNKHPGELSDIKKIHVGISTAPIDDKRTDTKLAHSGVLQPSDSLWDHLRYEQSNTTKDKKEKIVFIHTCTKVYGDSDANRRRVLQIKTHCPKSPFVADSYIRNVMFERQVLAMWNGEASGAAPEFNVGANAKAGAKPISPGAKPLEEDEAKEFLITFNPKELLLLEKAFDNNLTPRDLKNNGDRWNDEDQKRCQFTIMRAQNEFKYVYPRKSNKNKTADDENGAAAKQKESDSSAKLRTGKDAPTISEEAVPEREGSKKRDATDSTDAPISKKAKTSPATKKKESKKDKKTSKNSPAKQAIKEEDVSIDSDDEPIVKLKTPAKKTKTKTPTKKTSREEKENKPAKSVSKKATPKKKDKKSTRKFVSKKHGREKSVGASPKKTRSSRSRK
mmetsp:Transcript_61216/g.124821  ORF Transcript_61216/g.124821 Transcript_61216/m.124821 type:complete len:559 (+) Transcript_61216:139-1815(+)